MPSCTLNVKIGTGSEYNWNGHLGSADHIHKEKKKPAPMKHLMLFFTKLLKLVLHDSPEAGPSSATVEPAHLSNVLDPFLVSTTCSDTSTLNLFPNAGRYDEDLQSAQLSLAVGEISPLDFNIDIHQDSDKPVFMAQGTPPVMCMITQL